MIRPNVIGPKLFYINPNVLSATTAVMAAIDEAAPSLLPSVQAYTATVREDYDSREVSFDGTADSVLAANMQVAFGLFLTPDNDKRNLLFQLRGSFHCLNTGAGRGFINSYFFFGRKATDNTVVSSVAAPANALAGFTIVSPTVHHEAADTDVIRIVNDFEKEIVAVELAGGFNWCFGFLLQNMSATAQSLNSGRLSLAFRKYASELTVNIPSR